MYFSEDNVQLLEHEASEDTFGKLDNLQILIHSSGSVLSQQGLAAISELTADAWLLPHATRVDSLSNFQEVRAEADDIIVADLIPNDASHVRHVAAHEPALHNRLLSKDESLAIIDVSLNVPEGRDVETVHAARTTIDNLQADYPGLTFQLGGSATMNNDFGTVSFRDAALLFPSLIGFVLLASSLLVAMMGCSPRTCVKYFLFQVLAIVLTLIATLGWCGVLGVSINAVSLQAPLIIVVIVVVNCMHLLVAHLRDSENLKAPTTNYLAKPITITSLTTALGFLALNFSASPPFHDLGNFVALGMVWGLVMCLGLANLFLSTSDKNPDKGRFLKGIDIVNSSIAHFGDRRNLSFLTIVALAIVVLAGGISQLHLDDATSSYFKKGIALRDAHDIALEHGLGTEHLSYTMTAKSARGVHDVDFLTSVRSFQEWLRSQNGVVSTYSLVDTLEHLNDVLHEGRAEALPLEPEAISNLLLLYELSLPYGFNIERFVNAERSKLRLLVSTNGLRRAELLALDDAAVKWGAEHIAESTDVVGATGFSVMGAHIGMLNIRSMVIGNAFSIIAMCICLTLALGSIRIGFTSVLTNIVPPLIAFGVWGYLVGQVNLSFATVFATTLGIIVDDTVHLLYRYRQYQGGHRASWHYAISETAPALIFSTVILTSGFSIFILGSFAPNSTLGTVAGMVIVVALLFDLYVLPHVLAIYAKGK